MRLHILISFQPALYSIMINDVMCKQCQLDELPDRKENEKPDVLISLADHT